MSKSRRIVVLTDLHLRSDSLPGFLQTQLDTCERLVNSKKADAVIINGDIFHHRNPRSEEILKFNDLLQSFNCSEIVINRGNHDTLRKDGSSDSILSVYSNVAEVVTDSRMISVAGVPIDFIPHYEDESRIIEDIKSGTGKIMFGHFGYNRCVKYGGYFYKSKIRKEHLTKPTFLGHIHSPKDHNNIYIIGTPYSSSFHEANQIKKSCDIVTHNGNIEVVRKPIEFGIKHVSTQVHKLDEMHRKFNFDRFYTVLRVKLDKIDAFSIKHIKKEILDKYKVRHLEFEFSDLLPRTPMELSNVPTMVTVDDKVIKDYIINSKTEFSEDELWSALEEIRNATE